MRIKKITVKNLFGIFNHEIPLNMQNHMTIIHGPNGFGKTVLLTMLNALFSSRYHELRRIPYSELSVDFDDSSNLRLKKTIQPEVEERNRGDDGFKLVLEFSKNGSKSNYTIPSITSCGVKIPIIGHTKYINNSLNKL